MERPTGVTVIAVLDFIGAGLVALVAIGLIALGGVLTTAMSSTPLAALTGAGAVIVAVICLGFAALGIVIGIGMLKLRNWARIVTIVLTGLGLLGGVLGLLGLTAMHTGSFAGALVRQLITIAIDVWILWYLFQAHVKQAFGATGF
jgi:hypothetical protein